jgi:GNAT superfamily N-acetyltransferase
VPAELSARPAAAACADVLAAAFAEEPALRWICGPGGPGRHRWFAATARAHAGVPGARRYLLTDGGAAVAAALVTPPAGQPGPLARLAWTVRVAVGCGPATVRRTLALLAATEAAHPAGAWTLDFVGVLPTARGRGAGRALLDRVIADAAGEPLFLTTADPANVGLYRRFGWRQTGDFRVGPVRGVAMCRPAS